MSKDKSLFTQAIRERTEILLQTPVEYAIPSLWTRLPRELALLIVSLLDTPTLLNARTVCRAWRRLAADVKIVRCALSIRVSYYLALFPRLDAILLDREFGGIFLLVNKESFWQELHRRGVFLDVRPLVHPPLDTTTGFTLLPTLVGSLKRQNLWRYALVFEYLQMSLTNDTEHCGLQTAFDIHEADDLQDAFRAAQADLAALFQSHKTSRYLLSVLPVVLMRLHLHKEALAVSDMWLSAQPDCISAYLARGRLLGWMNQYANAVSVFSHALGMALGKPSEAVLLDDRAMAYSSMNLYEESIQDYQRSISLHPNEPGIYVDYGYTLYNVGRLEEAVASATRSIALVHLSTSYNMRGWARLQLEDYEEAYEDFREALAEGFLPIPIYGQAEVRFHMGMFAEAAMHSAQVIEHKGPPLSSALWIHGMALRALGHKADAEKDFDRLLQLTPNYSYERVATAMVLIERGELLRALTLLDEAIQIQPGNWRYRVARGNLLGARLNRWLDALADWRRAIQLHPQSRSRIADSHLEEATRIEHETKKKQAEAELVED